MVYKKNLPRWERVARFITGALMASCAVRYGLTPVGLGFGVATLFAVATAFVGFCPMCALAGRHLRSTGAASSS